MLASGSQWLCERIPRTLRHWALASPQSPGQDLRVGRAGARSNGETKFGAKGSIVEGLHRLLMLVLRFEEPQALQQWC